MYYATGGNTQKQAANRMAITSREMGIRLPSDCDGLQRVVRPKLGAAAFVHWMVYSRVLLSRDASQETEDNDG